MKKHNPPENQTNVPEGPRTFGQWVKSQRTALGLTQDNLAQRVVCSKSTINKIERNERLPSKAMAEQLALYLKIPSAEYASFIHLALPNLLLEPNSLPTQTRARAIPSLPTPLTGLIGREEEVASISSLLQRASSRLITLTGPGGTGKTRLAIQVAAEMEKSFADGVHFISLAPVHDPALVLPTIAQTLGLKSARDQRDEELLVNYLHDKAVLLVLDNFEQVLGAAKAVAELLMFTERFKVLVTSRAVLRLNGEYEFAVPPLALPSLNMPANLHALADSPAVRLFAEHARLVRPYFELNENNAYPIAEICARLDGLPLAIELAAARCKVISPEAILKRLKNGAGGVNIDLLSGGGRDLPDRHQALRQTMEWSYNLLTPQERLLFRRLGVFVGGNTLDVIEEICEKRSASSRLQANRAESALNLAISLIDQSLLRQVDSADGEPRFFMLETLREYALECLAAASELEMMQRQHAVYFLRLAESIETKLHGPEQEICLQRLEVEFHNLRAALAWSSDHDLEMALRLASALWQFWLTRGYLSEGRAWMSDILQRPGADSFPLARARVLNGAGLLLSVQGDTNTANVYLQESLRLFRELGDTLGEAWVLNHLGQVLNSVGQKNQAMKFFERSLNLFREQNAQWHSAWVLVNLGDVNVYDGDRDLAQQFLSEARDLFKRLGDQRGAAAAIDRLGVLAHLSNEFERALPLFAESRRLFDLVGDVEGSAWALYHLGRISYDSGKHAPAFDYLVESLRLFEKLGDQWGSFWALLCLGQTVFDQNHLYEAAVLMGATDTLVNIFHHRLLPADYNAIQETLQKAHARLEPAAWATGQALPTEKALALALETIA